MTTDPASSDDRDDVQRLSVIARRAGTSVAVAESLTSGLIASRLGAGEDAADWFAGGVVAYQTRTKIRVLGLRSEVDPCSAECAQTLAVAIRSLLESDIAVSATGVGGPEPEDGHPPGTVYLGWATTLSAGSRLHRFDGDPAAVLAQTRGCRHSPLARVDARLGRINISTGLTAPKLWSSAPRIRSLSDRHALVAIYRVSRGSRRIKCQRSKEHRHTSHMDDPAVPAVPEHARDIG